MKRYLSTLLLVLFCLTPFFCYGAECEDSCSDPVQLARMSPAILGASSGAVAAASDSCTGHLLFSWHCENEDVTLGGVAGGVNNGCSVGDTTATANSSAAIDSGLYQDGAKSCDFPGNLDYYSFTVTPEETKGEGDICNLSYGTFDFYFYYTAFWTGQNIVACGSSTEYVYVRMEYVDPNALLKFYHLAGGTARYVNSSVNMSSATWYHVVAKWSKDDTGATNYLQICVDDQCANNTAFALGTPTTDLSTFTVGPMGNYAFDIHIDNLKIYDNWQ